MLGKIRSAENDDFDKNSSTYESSTFSKEVNFFSSAVGTSSSSSTAIDPITLQNILSDASGRASALTSRMTKSLRALSDKNKFDEARKYPGQLSDALLFTSLISKSIGKTAQCVDKICNLQ